MNSQRRKQLEAVRNALDLQKSELEVIRDEEESAFMNLPDSLQGGERGQKMEDAVSQIAEAIDSLESLVAELDQML